MVPRQECQADRRGGNNQNRASHARRGLVRARVERGVLAMIVFP